MRQYTVLVLNPWLIPVNVWQIPLQYCKVTSLQLIKINGKKWPKKKKKEEICYQATKRPEGTFNAYCFVKEIHLNRLYTK